MCCMTGCAFYCRLSSLLFTSDAAAAERGVWCVGVVCGGGGVWGWWGWLPLDIDWSMDLDALRACIDRAMRLTYAGQSRVCERKKVCL